MRVVVNGEPRELPAHTTVAAMMAGLPGVPGGRGVAVAVDGEVVARGGWERTELADGSHVEVVMAVQGG